MWKINNIKIKIVPFEIYHDVNVTLSPTLSATVTNLCSQKSGDYTSCGSAQPERPGQEASKLEQCYGQVHRVPISEVVQVEQ